MKFYGEANLQQNYLKQAVLPLDEAFPVEPVVGQLVFKNGILYICLSLDNSLPIWCPLTKEITLYTHVQSTPATTWSVSHGLNTTSVIVTVYDANNLVIIPDEINIVNSTLITVKVTTASIGKVVVLTGHVDGVTVPVYAFEFYQTNPSTTWSIDHNLGRNPIVRVFVGNQEVQPASITFTTANTVTVTFTTPQAGYAKLL